MLKSRSFFTWLGQLCVWLVIVAIVAAITATVLIPRLGGATPYTILTGSMQPKYPPGTLMIMKPAPVKEISVGSVVTYQLNSGKPTVVTHRVVAIGTTVNGKRTFTTQGDANNVADEKPVRPVQIKGKLWYSVPYLGYVNNFITGKQRQIATYIVVGFLFLYAAYMFSGVLRDRAKKHRKS